MSGFGVWIRNRIARSLEMFSRTFCFSIKYHELLSWAFAGRGGTSIFPAPGNWDQETNIFRKSEACILIPIIRFNSCNKTLFTGMALTLHKNLLHCSGVMQWWACSSLMTTASSAESCYLICESIVLLLPFVA